MEKHQEYNGMVFTLDDTTGYYLAARPRKGETRRLRMHEYVWTCVHGVIPKGYHIHHKDHDKSNNTIENLELLIAHDHLSMHMKDRDVNEMRRIMNDYARPAACLWHKSDAGREWHSKMSKESWEKKEPIEYTCSYCGKRFKTKNSYSKTSNTFCSNNCKSAFRRKSGVDNVERICVICGEKFSVNRYSKKCTCSPECSGALRSKRRAAKRVQS